MSSDPLQMARERLIVGLDVSTWGEAEAIVDRLGDEVIWYKIGYQLAYAGSLPLVSELARAGKRVFLDLKLLDISNTVAKGTESAMALGASLLTVHAYPHAMRAALEASKGSALSVLGVTVLTSLDEADLKQAGYDTDIASLVEKRALQAREIGIAGIVASPMEAARLRPLLGADMAIVTPGIRPSGAAAGDQKRIATPASALRDGASHLVVARPVVGAEDPAASARAILEEMASVL